MGNATARWSGSQVRFEIESGSGHRITVDEPPVIGTDAGMRPTELLLGALAGCTGVNAVSLLRKFKQPFDALSVEVEGDQEPEWPHAFTAIRITFAIHWTGDADAEAVAKALEMACNRYCPVDATLTRGTQISHSRRDV